MITVHDGDRTLSFRGEKIAESSSETSDSVRWIEFEIYRVESGGYVIARTGVSLVYHMPTCELAEKYGLEEWDPEESLTEDSYPCEICRPDASLPYVCPETTRYWARACDSARGVVQTLYKKDGRGVRYITNVAARLLDDAASADDGIARAYYNQTL
jgi:hypothetical protein